VAGRTVLDLGAGSGLVGIAAAKANARHVIAAYIDRWAIAAIGLNAAANGVAISTMLGDLTTGLPPGVDVVLVGDLFYAEDLARRLTAFLDRCLESGIDVLVGGPGRASFSPNSTPASGRVSRPGFRKRQLRRAETECGVQLRESVSLGAREPLTGGRRLLPISRQNA
jgi:predicted nicotinamide N-methyase